MGDVAVDLAAMVQQIVMRGRLPSIVQLGRPFRNLGSADELSSGNDASEWNAERRADQAIVRG
jgi:hypothetical protein